MSLKMHHGVKNWSKIGDG